MRSFEDNLRQIHSIIAASGCSDSVWLCGGLVLGFARNGIRIPGDKDADFGVYAACDACETALYPAMLAGGFRGRHVWTNNAGQRTEYVFVKDGKKFEFFRHWISAGKMTWYAYHGGRKLQLTRIMPEYALKPQQFMECKWLMPHPLEEYCLRQYGKGWKKRNARYDYTKHAPCNVKQERWRGSAKWQL